MNQLSQQTSDAMEALQHCHAVCQSMAMTHCLEMGGEHARPQHLRLMLDCAALCAFAADALGRKSQFHNHFAGLCAEVCETCAKDCEALYLPCPQWQAAQTVEELEQSTGKPVIAYTHACFFAAFRSMGVTDPISGHGRLLASLAGGA